LPVPATRLHSPRSAPAGRAAPVGLAYVVGAFAIGVVFVATPVLAYVAAAPDHSRFVGQCGALSKPHDEYGIMVSVQANPGRPPAIEILDPLCPACRGFEERLTASGMDAELDRKAVLFPLDNTCNWMVDSAVHPGACAVSEAMLCAGDRASNVLEWSFANQDRIRDAATADKEAAAALVKQQFPDLASCIGSAQVRSKLNRSLRWAVANQLPVLTPQLYVGGVKLCDEDVDLGLEFSLRRMLDAYQSGKLAPAATPGATPGATIDTPAPTPAETPGETAGPAQGAPSSPTPESGITPDQEPKPAADPAAPTPTPAPDDVADPAPGETGEEPAEPKPEPAEPKPEPAEPGGPDPAPDEAQPKEETP
jgi:hypothetical protein